MADLRVYKNSAPRKLELLVVFDTNALYTESEAHLVSEDTVKLVERHSGQADIEVTWCLPDVVRHERQYQMQTKALGFLSPVQRLEALMGRELGVSDESIRDGVNAAVEKELKRCGLTVEGIDVAKVDWPRLIRDSCYRQPPFKEGPSEKGFRDALIAETFGQLVEARSPHPSDCHIFFVSNDNLLIEAVRKRTSGAANVDIAPSLAELDQRINLLAGKPDPDFLARYQTKANEHFQVLYSQHDIASKIREDYKEKLASTPVGADERNNIRWSLDKPRFRKLEGKRVFWVSRIVVEAEAYMSIPVLPGSTEYATDSELIAGETDATSGWIINNYWLPASGSVEPTKPGIGEEISTVQFNSNEINIPRGTSGWFSSERPWRYDINVGSTGRPKKMRVNMGRSVFEVVWSTVITGQDEFSDSQIESISYIKTTWAQ